MALEQTPKNYNFLIILLTGSIFLMLVSLAVVFYQVKHQPIPSFEAITPAGEKMQLMPLDSPNLLPETILRWASKAAVAAYTFDFVNFREQLKVARPYFTDAGWNEYLNAIGSVLDTIAQNKIFVNGVVAGTPVIANQGERAFGQYAWRVQMPFLVTYQSSEKTQQTRVMMSLTIVKIPTQTNPTGIGIDEFIMK